MEWFTDTCALLALLMVAEASTILKTEKIGNKKRVGMSMVMQVSHTDAHHSQKTSVSSADTNHRFGSRIFLVSYSKNWKFFQERYATKNHGAIGLPRFPRAINSLMVHSIQKF